MQDRDSEIIKLFFERSEDAVSRAGFKYGSYLKSIARRMLRDERDVEETVQDAFLAAWDSIPPNRPDDLGAYLGRLVRNAAIDRAKLNSRKKRGGGEAALVLDEIAELVPGGTEPEEALAGSDLAETINGFLKGLPQRKRRLFVQRYWYFMGEREIAEENLMAPAAVRMQLSRTRRELKAYLAKEGYVYE
ncbi:MAG: sigma-70 family RNA polymerase sigma factor [Clostridia bacterium]|nr:sigma-70 family RNA polymerase sigma factor [Clostridia bacterium]